MGVVKGSWHGLGAADLAFLVLFLGGGDWMHGGDGDWSFGTIPDLLC